MDKALLSACIGAATTVAATGGHVLDKHHSHATAMIVKVALELHDLFEQKISEREAIKGELPGVKEGERV